MTEVPKISLTKYVNAAYTEATSQKHPKPIQDIKLAAIAKGFFEAKKNKTNVSVTVIQRSKELAEKKITYYKDTTGGYFRKFFSALKNLFKFGDFSSTAVIVKKSIKEYEENLSPKQNTNIRIQHGQSYDEEPQFVSPEEIVNYAISLIGLEASKPLDPVIKKLTDKILKKMLTFPGLVVKEWNTDYRTDIIKVKLAKSFDNDQIKINENFKFRVKQINEKGEAIARIEFTDKCVEVKIKGVYVNLISMDVTKEGVMCKGSLGPISMEKFYSSDEIIELFNKPLTKPC